MGNSNCISCLNILTIKPPGNGTSLEIITRPKENKEFTLNYDPIQTTLIQSTWRCYIQKKNYQFLRKFKTSSSFFLKSELFETLSDQPLSLNTDTHEYEYLSGTIYDGEWLGGFRHGNGICTWVDGSNYSGAWSFGYPNGFGKFSHSNGETFSGNWQSPYASRESFSSKKDGFVWLSEKPQLKNIKSKSQLKQIELLYLNLERLKKQFFEMQEEFSNIEASGDVCDKSGILYQGELVDGEKNGFGVSRWGNGDYYRGFWKNNKKEGLGKEEWVDGSKFFGNYVDGEKKGIGEYMWEDGSSYLGEWDSNQHDGLGIYVWNDGRVYEGFWKSGLMHGFGVFAWPNGTVYEGEWSLGKKHGIGISRSSDGSESKSLWECGKVKKFN